MPNLETKFVTANTLIGINRPSRQLSISDTVEIRKLKEELRLCRHKIFSAKTKKTKQKYRKIDKEKRQAIAEELKNNGWNNDDADKLASWDPYDQNESSPFFDPEWMFGLEREYGSLDNSINGGFFDVVIANPPYMDSELMVNLGLDGERKYIINNYKYISGNWDIYMAFFEKGMQLSRFILCYITPDKWLSKPFGLKYRKDCMLPKLKQITHLGTGVFESATVDAIITLFIDNEDETSIMKYKSDQTIKLQNKSDISYIKNPFLIDFLFSENSNLILSIEAKNREKLIQIAECENACATSDAYKLSDLIYNSDNFNIDTQFKLINTGTIGKYINRWGEKEITYLGSKLLYPTVNRDQFSEMFGRSYVERSFSKKVIFKGLNLLDACVDLDGSIIPGKTTLVLCSDRDDDLKFLLALINSKLVFNYIKIKYSSSSYCGGITFTKDMINHLPLPSNINNYKSLIVNLVENILEIKADNIDNDISNIENRLNLLIYKLYNLTYEEVLIIDPDIDFTEEEYTSQ